MSSNETQSAEDNRSQGKVLCFVSAKGGSGKTVLAATCASLLMKSGKSVLVVDTDFSTRGLSLFLLDTLSFSDPDAKPENCLAEILLQTVPLERIAPLVVAQKKGLFHILLPNRDFRRGGAPEEKLLGAGSGFGGNIDIESLYLEMLQGIRARFSQEFDYIIIDTRGGYDYTSRVPAVLADAYIVVLEADPISVQQVNGLQLKIQEFAARIGASPRQAGFIINKALFSPEEGKVFSSGLESLYGSQTLGVIPADRNVISAYQTRDIPFQKSPGSDFSYYSLQSLDSIFIAFFGNNIPPEFTRLKQSIVASWRIGQIIKSVERFLPIIVLCLLAASLVAFLGYQVGVSWATSRLIFAVTVLLSGFASIMPLVREAAEQRATGSFRLRGWILSGFATLSAIALFTLVIPRLKSSVSADTLVTQLRSQLLKIDATNEEKQNALSSLAQADIQLKVAQLENQNLQKQLYDLSAQLHNQQTLIDAANGEKQKALSSLADANSQLKVSQFKIENLQKQLSIAQDRSAQLDAERARLLIALAKAQGQVNQSSNVWQANIDWSLRDTGPVDCARSYDKYQNCVASGGRSCLMHQATEAALHGDDSTALQLTLITQCHNPEAARTIKQAGARAVGDYLRSVAKGVSF
jgi:cellulose biosynthesis protein BcsQ